MNLKKTKLGFIGGGIMAENILKGILQSGLMNKSQITVSDLNASRLALIKKQFNIKTEKDNKKVVSLCDIIVLAVKPQNMKELLEEVSANSNNKKLFRSGPADFRKHFFGKVRTVKDEKGYWCGKLKHKISIEIIIFRVKG